MNDKMLVITIGMSGSGKSTWAESYTRNRGNWVELNRDNVRFNFGKKDWTKYKFTNKNEKQVTKTIGEQALKAVECSMSIIISDTNLKAKIRQKWITFAKEHDYQVITKEFPITWEEAMQRNQQREGGIALNILRSQWERWNDYIGRKVYVADESSPKAVLIDLDGTVADMKGVRKPFEWYKAHLDKPRETVISMVHGLVDSGITPVFMSGRDGVCIEATYNWIQEHILPDGGFYLFMRTAGDSRKDYVVKEELFWKYVDKNFNVVSVIDDRKSVLELWEDLKLPNIINVGGLYERF